MAHEFVVVSAAGVFSSPKDVVVELGGNNCSTSLHVARSDVPNLLSCAPTPARRERANGRMMMVKLQLIAEVGRDIVRVTSEENAIRDFIIVGWGANLTHAIKDAIA